MNGDSNLELLAHEADADVKMMSCNNMEVIQVSKYLIPQLYLWFLWKLLYTYPKVISSLSSSHAQLCKKKLEIKSCKFFILTHFLTDLSSVSRDTSILGISLEDHPGLVLFIT